MATIIDMEAVRAERKITAWEAKDRSAGEMAIVILGILLSSVRASKAAWKALDMEAAAKAQDRMNLALVAAAELLDPEPPGPRAA